MIRIGLINTYLEGRETLIPSGEYPAHHLWGADHLPGDRFAITIIPHRGRGLMNRLARWSSRLTRFRFGDLDQEWEIWRRRGEMDIAYVAAGSLFFLYVMRAFRLFRPKIVRWAYLPPGKCSWWRFRDQQSRVANRGTDFLLCLTQRAAQGYRAEVPFVKSIKMDWGADCTQFCPGPRDGGFFFACGKNNRDYGPLLQAAPNIPAPIHLVVYRALLDGHPLASNVHVENGSPDGYTDRGISYSELVARFYQRALGVLIPLLPIPDDASGMTNLLEAMACALPVIMTRTGAIDLDIEAEGIGVYVNPGDVEGWISACRHLLDHPDEARAMGDRGRRLVEQHYNTRRLGMDLASIFEKLNCVSS